MKELGYVMIDSDTSTVLYIFCFCIQIYCPIYY